MLPNNNDPMLQDFARVSAADSSIKQQFESPVNRIREGISNAGLKAGALRGQAAEQKKDPNLSASDKKLLDESDKEFKEIEELKTKALDDCKKIDDGLKESHEWKQKLSQQAEEMKKTCDGPGGLTEQIAEYNEKLKALKEDPAGATSDGKVKH